MRTKRRKKIVRPRIPMLVPDAVNQRWSLDFVSDQLANGRRFRVLNIVDDFSREYVLQVVDFSISGHRVARELDQISRTLPKTIVCDNSPEFTSKAMYFWSKKAGVKLHFIQPGKPTHNAFVESFIRQAEGVLPRPALVRQHRRRSLHARRLETSLQLCQAAQIDGQETTGGVRKGGRLI